MHRPTGGGVHHFRDGQIRSNYLNRSIPKNRSKSQRIDVRNIDIRTASRNRTKIVRGTTQSDRTRCRKVRRPTAHICR